MNGVTIGGKHSYTDYGLYMRSAPEISPPTPRILTVDIPGGNGSIDMTESLTGDVRYKTRKIKMTFTVIDARNRWPEIYSQLMDEIHGQRLQIIFDNDVNYYYEGRLSINQWKSSKKTAAIVIEAEVDPYKLDVIASDDDWLWDSFSFESGVIRDTNQISVNGSYTVTLTGSRKPTVLNVTSSAAMTVKYGGKSYSIKKGENIIPGIVIREGDHDLLFTGNGTITIHYRGGRL